MGKFSHLTYRGIMNSATTPYKVTLVQEQSKLLNQIRAVVVVLLQQIRKLILEA